MGAVSIVSSFLGEDSDRAFSEACSTLPIDFLILISSKSFLISEKSLGSVNKFSPFDSSLDSSI